MMRRSTDASWKLQDGMSGAEPDVGFRDSGPGLSLHQLLHILFKRKWLVLAVFLLCVTTAKVVDAFVVTPAYVATSQILVTPGREHIADLSLPSGGALPPWLRFNTNEETARTVQLLTGRVLVKRVVSVIGADRLYPEPASGTLRRLLYPVASTEPARREAAAIDRFIHDLEAQADSRSSIIDVSFKHSDPELAARAVNLLGDLFVERYLAMYQDPRANAFLEEQFGKLKQQLRQSEERLLAFKQRHGLTSSVSEEQHLLREMQTGLREQLTDTRSQHAALQGKAAELQRQMSDHGTLYGNLQAELLRNAAEVKALRAREDGLEAKIAEQQSRLDALERMRDDYNHLEKQVKADEDNYRLYLTKFEEVRMAGAMDKERIVSVRVLEAADIPDVPVRSKLELLTVMSAPLGLLGGVALAILLQLVRSTLDTAADIESALGLPVLASIPIKN
jgi:uncharacterized protein involved in exopolysaccharide biosynthesis